MFLTLYSIVKWIGNLLQSPFLLLIRLYWGYQFAITGFGKLLNISSIAEYFASLSIPFPTLNAVLAGSTEMIGGALLFLGLFSRLASIPLLVVMAVAFLTAEHEQLVELFTMFDPDPLLKTTPFLFAYTLLVIFCFGPGKFSFDYFLFERNNPKSKP